MAATSHFHLSPRLAGAPAPSSRLPSPGTSLPPPRRTPRRGTAKPPAAAAQEPRSTCIYVCVAKVVTSPPRWYRQTPRPPSPFPPQPALATLSTRHASFPSRPANPSNLLFASLASGSSSISLNFEAVALSCPHRRPLGGRVNVKSFPSSPVFGTTFQPPTYQP